MTATGLKNVIDRKVVVNGALRNVIRRVTKRNGALHTVWQRPSPNTGLTTWHPRWAKIDLNAGYTTTSLTDENGGSFTLTSRAINRKQVACIGDRYTGTLYYFNSSKMYKKELATGVVSVLWEDNVNSYYRLTINEETGAVYATNDSTPGNSTFIVAPSVQALGTAPILGTANRYTEYNKWINGLILVNNNFYDSNGDLVRTLPASIPSNTYTEYAINGNDTDGYFVTRKQVNAPRQVYSYDWESNTASLMYEVLSANTPRPTETLDSLIDTERAAVLLANNSNTDGTVYRTTDGINFTQLNGAIGSYGNIYNNHFQHINMHVSFYSVWDGNIDTCYGNSSNTLFPGFLAPVDNTFYAGKQMLLNGSAATMRLWDIVPK